MYTLSATGLCLRPFGVRDAAAFAAAARESAESVGRWMPWCHAHYSEQEARDWFGVCQQHLADETAFEFGIFAEQGGELLGGAGLNTLNRQHNLCNLGYWVRQSRQRQRVAIARALVSNPSCLLADEPTGNLDSHTASVVFGLLIERVRQQQVSLIVVTHDEKLAARCSKILRLAEGRLLQ